MNRVCILYVEDEQADIDLLRFAFKKTGIRNPLQVVTDGQAAIDYLSGAGSYADRQQFPMPCLVVLDVKLPKISGLEVLAWMRKEPALKHIVVIVFSSSAHPVDVERAYDFGANSFIQKPAGLQANLEIAQLLKAWWLGYNRFVPVCETSQQRQ